MLIETRAFINYTQEKLASKLNTIYSVISTINIFNTIHNKDCKIYK